MNSSKTCNQMLLSQNVEIFLVYFSQLNDVTVFSLSLNWYVKYVELDISYFRPYNISHSSLCQYFVSKKFQECPLFNL